MKTSVSVPFATTAIFTLAAIKAAIEAFDRGESNMFDALDGIVVAVDAYRAAVDEPSRARAQRHAA